MLNYIIELFLYMNNITLEVNCKIKKFHQIVISNHISNLDSIILFYIFNNNNKNYRFISDSKVKNIPIFGSIANYFNTIYINKRNPKKALEIMKANIKKMDNICIFPEGALYYKPTIKRSDKICRKLKIKEFKNVLCPKKSGFNCIKSIIKPKYITDITLTYVYPKDFIKKSNKPLTIKFLLENPPIKIICDIKNIKVKRSNNFITHIFRNKDQELNKNLTKNYDYEL